MCIFLHCSSLTTLGGSLFLAARGILGELRRIRKLTEIRNDEGEDRMISEGTEDGIIESPLDNYLPGLDG